MMKLLAPGHINKNCKSISHKKSQKLIEIHRLLENGSIFVEDALTGECFIIDDPNDICYDDSEQIFDIGDEVINIKYVEEQLNERYFSNKSKYDVSKDIFIVIDSLDYLESPRIYTIKNKLTNRCMDAKQKDLTLATENTPPKFKVGDTFTENGDIFKIENITFLPQDKKLYSCKYMDIPKYTYCEDRTEEELTTLIQLDQHGKVRATAKMLLDKPQLEESKDMPVTQKDALVNINHPIFNTGDRVQSSITKETFIIKKIETVRPLIYKALNLDINKIQNIGQDIHKLNLINPEKTPGHYGCPACGSKFARQDVEADYTVEETRLVSFENDKDVFYIEEQDILSMYYTERNDYEEQEGYICDDCGHTFKNPDFIPDKLTKSYISKTFPHELDWVKTVLEKLPYQDTYDLYYDLTVDKSKIDIKTKTTDIYRYKEINKTVYHCCSCNKEMREEKLQRMQLYTNKNGHITRHLEKNHSNGTLITANLCKNCKSILLIIDA